MPRVWVWLAACVAVALLGDAALLIARRSPSARPAADVIIDLLFGLPGAVSFLLVIATVIASVVLGARRDAPARGATGAPRAPLSLWRKLQVGLVWTIAGLMIAILGLVVIFFVRSSLTTGVPLNDTFVLLGFLAAWIGVVQLLFSMASALRTRPLGGPSVAGAARPAEPDGPAAASPPRAPTVVARPLTPAMREALERERRKRRKAGLVYLGVLEAIPLVMLVLLIVVVGVQAAQGRAGAMAGGLRLPVLIIGGLAAAIGLPLGGIVAWGDWRWRRMGRSQARRATGPITMTSRTFGSFAFEPQYQMQLVDRVVIPAPGSGFAPMELAWGSVDFTRDGAFVFEVRDDQGRSPTPAPGYAPE